MKPSLTGILLLFATLASPTYAASTNTPTVTHISLELRDGSRVIGVFSGKKLALDSVSVGEFKMPVERIRKIEWRTDKTPASLQATNGDQFQVELQLTELPVSTSFGEIKVPVGKIRQLQFSIDNGQKIRLLGLVALWSAEGDARDSISDQNGVVEGSVSYAPGKVGQAFNFNGQDADVRVAASASLNVGAGNGFSIVSWINPTDVSVEHPIAEWNAVPMRRRFPQDQWNSDAAINRPTSSSYLGYGAHFWISTPPPDGKGTGCLYANLRDTVGAYHIICSSPGLIVPKEFQHVAVTYDKTTGNAALYLNGIVVAQNNLGVFTPQTATDLHFGYRAFGAGAGERFSGQMDELSLYNRALIADEIQQLFEIGNH